MNKSKQLLFIAVIVILMFAIVEWNRPAQIDWRKSFSSERKSPYGSFLLFEMLPDLFPDEQIERIEDSFVVWAAAENRQLPANFIYICSEFSIDSLETRKMLDAVVAGNHIFIVAESFSEIFQKMTGADSPKNIFEKDFFQDEFTISDSARINFSNPRLIDSTKFNFEYWSVNPAFEEFDVDKFTVLGTNHFTGAANFLRCRLGSGALYLHASPLVFTNFYMMKTNTRRYISSALSYLPRQTTFWDEYYKPGRVAADNKTLSFVLSEAPLRWAYYLLLAVVLAYVLFEGKRRQRIVPVVEPPQNTSLEFIDTISNLHLHEADYRQIAMKKIHFFMDFLRRRMHVNIDDFSGDLYKQLAGQTGIDIKDIQNLFNKIIAIRKSAFFSEEDLIKLNRQIDEFYRKAGY